MSKTEEIDGDVSCLASNQTRTAKSVTLSTDCATSTAKPHPQCEASNDIRVAVPSDRTISSGLPKESPHKKPSNEIKENTRGDEPHTLSPETKAPHTAASSALGSIARWSPSAKRASVGPYSILSIDRELVTKLSDLALMHYHRSLQRSHQLLIGRGFRRCH